MYQIKRKQVLPITIQEAWSFFGEPNNLKKITPSHLSFQILSRSDAGEMYPGMIISYKISPLFNIALKWATEITQVKEYKYFIDNQISGPYKIWHHEHHFKEVDGGVEMRDILYYQLPYGILGRIAHRLIVRKKVKEIFNFRYKKIKELFD